MSIIPNKEYVCVVSNGKHYYGYIEANYTIDTKFFYVIKLCEPLYTENKEFFVTSLCVHSDHVIPKEFHQYF